MEEVHAELIAMGSCFSRTICDALELPTAYRTNRKIFVKRSIS
jgi:hypothetical protein